MIEVKNVTKTYGKKDNVFTALSDVSFSVPEGSSVAIIGKSGSGKSTLMHVMSGLDTADSGQVIMGGNDVQKLKRKQADNFRANEMSFIFQSFFVEGNQTVYQNVALPLEIAGVQPRRRKQLIKTALQSVELIDKINSKAKDLSGGQKQRLAIARAIVNSPKYIFADEPTGNLDSVTGARIVDLLFRIKDTMGSTLFIVTHDHELAEKCDQQVRMSDGRAVDIHQKAAAQRQPRKVML